MDAVELYRGLARRLPPPLERRLRRTRDALLPPRPSGGFDPAARDVEPLPHEGTELTDTLLSRLSSADVAEVEARLGAEDRRLWQRADPRLKKRATLAFGIHYEVPGVLEKTGLTPATPPPEVHSMSRGPLTSGGDYFYGDLVIQSLREAGGAPPAGGRALDLGCSSGRVVRALAAGFPEVGWYGCDPNAEAIEWAEKHLAGVRFGVSPQEPPLPYDDGAFDYVFAISIWSHYDEQAAVAWIDEMRRILRPGGRLLLTTHGYESIAHYARNGERAHEQLEEVGAALYARGFWFADEFGAAGDWGVRHSQWGTAFLTPEWLLARVCPPWSVRVFEPGRLESNQDLYVLERP